ncbi:hypothetical protein D1872_299350 [compost metagenome]
MPCRVVAVDPPQLAADFGHDDLMLERFGDVIVSSVFERHDLVHFAAPRRNKKDRTCGNRADLPTPVKPVIAWQIDIEQHKMGLQLLKLLQYSFEIQRLYGPVPVSFNMRT